MTAAAPEPQQACPHCPDGHKRPDHQPWSAWVTDDHDGDGQPTTIHVARSNGAHVAESDAQWIRERLNDRGSWPDDLCLAPSVTGGHHCLLEPHSTGDHAVRTDRGMVTWEGDGQAQQRAELAS